MTSGTEWSLAFDALWNNIMSNKAPGLNDYEKSLFLTQAQNELVRDYLSASRNTQREGYDDSAIRQTDFSRLVTTGSTYPNDAIMVISETAKVDGVACAVIPLSYEEYLRVMQKPYKNPPKGQVWRIWDGSTSLLIPDSATSYSVRYVKRPKPIISATLPTGLTIDGESAESVGGMPEHLHTEILVRAVNLAKIAWVDPTAAQAQ